MAREPEPMVPPPRGSCTQQGGTRAQEESWAAGNLGCKASGRDLGCSGQSLHPQRRPQATAGRGWRQGRPQQTQPTPPSFPAQTTQGPAPL